MKRIIAEHQLDTDRILQIADEHELIASDAVNRAFEKGEMRMMLKAANYYLISGLYLSSIDPEKTVAVFANAAGCLGRLNNPFFRLTNVLANGTVDKKERNVRSYILRTDTLFCEYIEKAYKYGFTGEELFSGKELGWFYTLTEFHFDRPKVQTASGIPYKVVMEAFDEVYKLVNHKSKKVEALKALLGYMNQTISNSKSDGTWFSYKINTEPYDAVALAIMKALLKLFGSNKSALATFDKINLKDQSYLFYYEVAKKLNKVKKPNYYWREKYML